MRSFTTVTSKGQVTIPIGIRRALGIREGDRVAVEQHDETVVLRRAGSVAQQTAGSLSAYRLETPLTPREERDAFGQAVAEEVAGLARTQSDDRST
jgi:AbrB family looped-hinge helix DNA binding protein